GARHELARRGRAARGVDGGMFDEQHLAGGAPRADALRRLAHQAHGGVEREVAEVDDRDPVAVPGGHPDVVMLSLCVVALLQTIRPEPPQAEVGTTVQVYVDRPNGAPLVNAPVRVRPFGGQAIELGSSDAARRGGLAPADPGCYVFERRWHDGDLRARFRAAARPPRRLQAWIGVPLGVALLAWNLHGLLRRRRPRGSRPDGGTPDRPA